MAHVVQKRLRRTSSEIGSGMFARLLGVSVSSEAMALILMPRGANSIANVFTG
jgi:hypothetical protein